MLHESVRSYCFSGQLSLSGHQCTHSSGLDTLRIPIA